MAAAYTAPGSYTSTAIDRVTTNYADLPGILWFQMKPPGTTARRVRVHNALAVRKMVLGWSVTGEFLENGTDGWGVFPPDVQAATPYNSAWISGQTGAPGGLWTHTPVDWRGNETGTKPGGWPVSPFVAVPPAGARP